MPPGFAGIATMHWWLAGVSFVVVAAMAAHGKFVEEATVTYLPRFNLLTELKFHMSVDIDPNTKVVSLDHFPPLVYALCSEHGLAHGQLSFTRGQWDAAKWAMPPFSPTSSGFQFHGWLSTHHGTEPIETRFNNMIRYASGSLGGSLNKLQFATAIKPTWPIFEPTDPASIVARDGKVHRLVAGLLPHEPLSVENLLPWIALLPSRGETGLASMLQSESLFRSEFHSMRLEVSVKCVDGDCQRKRIDTTLSMHLVYDLQHWNRQQQWTLDGLLGRLPARLHSANDARDVSVTLRIPNDASFIAPLLQHKSHASSEGNHLDIVYRGADILLPIGSGPLPDQRDSLNPRQPVHVFRFKTGRGDDTAAFGLSIENDGETETIVTVVESIPWPFKLFLHEVTVFLNDKPVPAGSVIEEMEISPAITRKRDYLMQSRWRVPARSRTQILIPIERAFMRVDEFPAGSERGIELPGALVSVQIDSMQYTLTTNTLLFTWPFPDATMPFNAITMSATVMALFYGAFFNMVFRRYYVKRPEDPPASPLARFIWSFRQKMRDRLRRVRQ